MLKIHTPEVYSLLAPKTESESLKIRLPEGWSGLYKHQVDTYRNFINPDVDVIFNTAMTGDGKSLAAYLPVLMNPKKNYLLATYPTNELITDQYHGLDKETQRFRSILNFDRMYSDEIVQTMEELGLPNRQEAILKKIHENEAILTNPDIFHLIMNFFYIRNYEAADKLIGRILMLFNYFVFDEFHIFQIPQVMAVFNALNFIYQQTKHKKEKRKFIFMSATPNPQLLQLLEKSGVNYEIVEGNYKHGSIDERGYRKIIRKTEIVFDKLERDYRIEDWLKENLHLVTDFFDRNPGSKGAIIVNSPFTAKRIVNFLQAKRNAGEVSFSVGENTGLTAKSRREKSRSKDMLVGTSTVDVGVDFEINFLVFESTDSGTFLQRLGRLGRHDGYQDELTGEEVKFNEFVAYSLLPSFIYERIEKQLENRREFKRGELTEIINGIDEQLDKPVFPNVNDFSGYIKRWGSLQAAHIVWRLNHPIIRKNYQSLLPELIDSYSQVTESDISKKTYQLFSIKKNQPQVFNELLTFRGSSYFNCGIWEELEGKQKDNKDEGILNYDLFGIVGGTIAEPISQKNFLAELDRRGIPKANYRNLLMYFKVYGYKDRREYGVITINRDLTEASSDYFHKVKVMSGFQINEIDDCSYIYDVNKKLKKKKLVCLISKIDRNKLLGKYALPANFRIYKLFDKYKTGTYSIAFGKEALLLDSILYRVKVEDDFWIV